MEKMLDLFKEPVEIQDLPDAKPLVMTKGDVVFGKRIREEDTFYGHTKQ